MRGRGLKLIQDGNNNKYAEVALHAGAWIETTGNGTVWASSTVALHAGAWIETLDLICSLPSMLVALHAGAWIETPKWV